MPENFDMGRYEIKSPSNKISFEKSRMSSPREESIIRPVKVSIEEVRNEKEVLPQNNSIVIAQKNDQLVA